MRPFTSSKKLSPEPIRLGLPLHKEGTRVSKKSLHAALRRLASLVSFSGAAVAAGILAVGPTPLRAQMIYWDTNGNTAGTSTIGSATWSQTGNATWANNATGTGSASAWNSLATSADTTVIFSAGTNGTGTQTVNVLGSISNVGNLTFEEGTVTIGGTGTLNLSRNSAMQVNDTVAGPATINATVAGAFTVTKTGNGTLVLGGNNTYTGLTTVGNGTLKLGTSGNTTITALGNAANGTAVAATGTLDLNGFSVLSAEALTLTGTGYTGQGTLINSSATSSTYAGLVTLGGATTINAASGNILLTNTGTITGASGNLTLTGNATGSRIDSVIGTGNGTLTKTGNGTWTLAGNNTYTGLTTIGNGTLALGATGNATNTPLGTTASSTSVAATGTLDVNGFTLGTAEALTLSGAGYNSQGTLINSSATGASYSGAITISGSATTISAAAGNLTLTGGISGTDLGVTLTGNATGAAVNSIIALGNGTLTKTGNGTWTLAGNNTYTGLTTIGNGTLALGATGNATNTPLGTTASGTSVAATGTLDVNGFTLGTAEALTLNGVGYNSQGALINSSATAATYSGAITVGANSTISASAGNLTLTGGITGTGTSLTLTGNATGAAVNSVIGLGSGTLTKTGNGTWTLAGNNTYIGLTTIGNGTLQLGATGTSNFTPLGSNDAGTVVAATGALDLNGFTLGTAEALTLNGVGYNSQGALINSAAASASYSGLVTLGASSTINAGTGNITLSNVGTITGSGFTLTLAGSATGSSIASIIGTGTGGLIKNGTGTWTLSGANTFTGGTTINAGTLIMGNSAALANGAVVINSPGTLNSSTYGFDLTKASGTGTLTGTSGTYAYNSASNATLGLTLAGGDQLAKSGSGTLALTGTNTYTGGTTISAGIVEARSNNALGTGNVTVASGAQLNVNGSNLTLGTTVLGNAAYVLTFAGNGTTGTGALQNTYTVGGNNNIQVNGNLALSGNATINSGTNATAGTMNTLQLGVVNVTDRTSSPGYVQEHSTFNIGGNTLTFTGGANTQTKIEARITGTGSVVINTSGVVNYYNPENTYTGSTTVQNGTLLIDTANNPWAPLDTPANGGTWNKFFGINGALIIGDDNVGNGLATVHLGDGVTQGSVNNGINTSSPVTIYRDGTFNVNGNSQTIGVLTMKGGTINTGVGTLFLDVANTTVSILDSDKPSVINGQLSLTHHLWAGHESVSDNRTFNVVYNAANNTGNVSVGDLIINANVQQGALTKTGNGTLLLASKNDYDGATTINDGILRASVGTQADHKSSLGLGNSGNATKDTIVNSGGTLQIVGNITMSEEYLTLRGTGYQNRGALENLEGNNTWGGGGALGQVLLGADATIKSTSGTLTLASTTISTGGEFGLTVTGDGNTTIIGAINTNVGNGTASSYVTKTGNGTLTLSGSSFYAGNTTISNGIVVITNNNALGSTIAGTNVASGAELRLTNNISVGAEALTLSGSGYGGTSGALNNYSGSNSYGGAITIGAPGTTLYSTTGTMTLSGTVATAGNSFIIAGAGNTTITGAVGGGGALTKNNSGTAILSNNVGVGNITMNAGTLTFSGATTTAGNVTMNAGTLNFNGGNTTVNQVHILGNASSTINVGTGATVNTGEIDSSVGSTLNIASGGLVNATYDSGNTLFSGQLAGSGTIKFLGNATVTFDHTINAPNLTVYIGGNSVGTNTAPLTFAITDTASLTFKDIYITGDTILDFGNSSASFLSSTNLYITAGVKITVTNWISMNDAWYVTGNSPGFSGATLNQTGVVPENQITFTGFSNNSTAWISPASYPQFRDHEIRPVPEPSTYGAIFAAGCLSLYGLRRHLRRRAEAAAK